MERRGKGGWLLGLGVASELIYLAMAIRLPWWRYGGCLRSWSQLLGADGMVFAACLAGVGVLTAAYVWGWRVVRQGGGERKVIWAFAILFVLTLIWLLPITSDLLTYVSHAHLFTDLKLSPLQAAPLDVPDDRLSQAYPSAYASHPSVYGPAWTLLSAPGTLGPHDVAWGVAYLKGLAAVAFLVCAWLVERILRQSQPVPRRGSTALPAVEGLYLFAWNPLLLLMAVGDGHNDVVMMAVVLLAFWFLLQERWVLSFAALTLSVWIKYVSVVFLPLFVIYAWKRLGETRRRDLLPTAMGGVLVVIGVSLLVFIPFWDPEMLPGIAERLLRPANWQGEVSDVASWALGTGLLLFVLAYVMLAWRLLRAADSFQRLADTGFFVSLLVFVLGAARSQPWHLIWPAALAGLADRRWAWPVVVGLSTAMLVVQVWVEWGAPGAQEVF